MVGIHRTRRGALAGSLFAGLVIGCGTDSSLVTIGVVDGGGGFSNTLGGDDSGASPTSLAISVDPGAPSLCAGECATLSARVAGGKAPYVLAWDHGLGSDGGPVTVCPTSTTTYHVTATDSSGGIDGEFQMGALTKAAAVTVTVTPTCPDAGAPACEDGGPGELTPASGHYLGTAYCPPDGGVVSFPSLDGGMVTANVVLDLAVDGSKVTGYVYFLWVPIEAIAGDGALQGSLDCSAGGQVSVLWQNGVWGIPGPVEADGGMTVVPTGTVTGSITAATVSGSPGTIHGAFNYVSAPASVSDTCQGSFSATLQH